MRRPTSNDNNNHSTALSGNNNYDHSTALFQDNPGEPVIITTTILQPFVRTTQVSWYQVKTR